MNKKQIELEILLNEKEIQPNDETMAIAGLFGIAFFNSNKKHGWYITKQVNEANTSKEECALHNVSESIVADVRNKLSPAKNLCAILKNTDLTKVFDADMYEIIKSEIEKVDKSIAYLSDISTYSR